MSNISRGNRGEKLVINKLGKIKEYHRLLNDVTFINVESEVSHQIDHIFIHPNGVFIIETKNYSGLITYDEKEKIWRKDVKGEITVISSPIKQNKSHLRIVKKILDKKIDVIPVVVFCQNNAPYLGEENVINLKDLNLFIESYPYQKLLDNNNIDNIYKILKFNSSNLTKIGHLENISYVKQINKELKKEKEYAIESGMCPRCGHKLTIISYQYHCPHCDYKFSL